MFELLNPFWVDIARWSAIAITALMLYFKIRKAGKDSANNDTLEKTLEGIIERDKIENDITGSSDAKLDELLKPYYRD